MASQTRVFTVFIYPVLSGQMLRAAMVVLNKFLAKELHPIPVLSKTFVGSCIWKVHQVIIPQDSRCISCVHRATN